jgi:sRNA-binding regulator protein Hfq
MRPSLPPGTRITSRRGRRQSPPEATHAEASYLLQAIQDGSTLVVSLMDGGELRGVLEYYDRHCIKLRRDGQPSVLVRKAHVKHYRVE